MEEVYEVYMVQQEDYSHVDSIWEKWSFADDRKTELNKDSIVRGYVVVEVKLNRIIENKK